MYASKKTEQAEKTRNSLEKVARRLFETRGFDAVSAEELVAAAGVTRGALYHHYNGKEGLFEAVVDGAMRQLHGKITAEARAAGDPLSALKLGAIAFLGLCTQPKLQRILFIDAPAVLGWKKWREMDARYGFGMLKGGLELAMHTKQIRQQPVDLLAHVLLSAMIEAAMVIAAAENKTAARQDAETVLTDLLAGLR